MGLALTHFAFGAGVMQVVMYLTAPRFQYRQTVALLSGVWALVPDIHYVSPVYREPLSELKFTVAGDLFWFHRTLDALNPGRGTRGLAAAMVVFLGVCTLLVEWSARRS